MKKTRFTEDFGRCIVGLGKKNWYGIINDFRVYKLLKLNIKRKGKRRLPMRRVTADTALRLSRYFGNSAKFWLGLQDDFDIEEEEQLKFKELGSIEHYQGNAV